MMIINNKTGTEKVYDMKIHNSKIDNMFARL